MSQQRQHDSYSDVLCPHDGGQDGAGRGATPAAASGAPVDVLALADAVIDRMRNDDSTRFLERVSQSPGE